MSFYTVSNVKTEHVTTGITLLTVSFFYLSLEHKVTTSPIYR